MSSVSVVTSEVWLLGIPPVSKARCHRKGRRKTRSIHGFRNCATIMLRMDDQSSGPKG